MNAELSLDLEIFAKAKKNAMKEAQKGKKLNLSDQEFNNLVYERIIKLKEQEMNKAVKELDFETAAILRDEIGVLRLHLEKK